MNKFFTAACLAILILAFTLIPASLPASNSIDSDKTASTTKSESKTEADIAFDNTNTINCKYFNDKDFMASVSKADAMKPAIKDYTGGIVPHHLLAGDMIAGFFRTISVSRPDTIVILAPNHKRSGSKAISTGYWSWQSAFGQTDTDISLVKYLISREAAGTSLDLLEEDHSISALVPYIKYYMPDAKIVPVMLYGNYGQEKSIRLGKDLAEQLEGKNSLVIASVDFSHYLSPEKAEAMDKETLKAINAMDIAAISRMSNDNLDSPPSIMALISYIKSSDASAPELLEHSNSSAVTGKWSSSTTSYFTIVY